MGLEISKFLSTWWWEREISIPGGQHLPVELVEEIMLAAWCPPCSLSLRRSYISFFLVNRRWAALMERIILRYVRLDSPPAISWYCQIFKQYQNNLPVHVPGGDSDGSGGSDLDIPLPETPPNPCDRCKDLVVIASWYNPYAIATPTSALSDLFQIVPFCSQVKRAEFQVGLSAALAHTILPLTKLTDLYVTALFLPLIDPDIRLTQIRALTIDVKNGPDVVAFIGICPALRSITLESELQCLESLSSYLSSRFDKTLPKRDYQVIVRPKTDLTNAALSAQADVCIRSLMELVPLVP